LADEVIAISGSKPEQVARLLLQRIIESGLRPGASFGTETELQAQFKVSRPTLRESLRILESQGVLTLRPGPRGGIIVSQPSVDIVAHTLSVFLRLNSVPFIAIVQARAAMEPALVRDAARNATDEDFDKMQASIERMKKIGSDVAAFADENRTFHQAIMQAAQNPVLEVFWSAIGILVSGEQHGMRYTAKNRKAIVTYHQRILDACRARDPDLAAQLMSEHIGELDTLLRKRFKNLVNEPTRIAMRPSHRKVG
jgi:GntR family transcriptional regulator, transcriptional repressor for pyruvate dehydrogenase complex